MCDVAGPQSPENEEQQQRLGYDFAQQELMEKELGNDPIQEAIGAIEKQHEEDKQGELPSPFSISVSLFLELNLDFNHLAMTFRVCSVYLLTIG